MNVSCYRIQVQINNIMADIIYPAAGPRRLEGGIAGYTTPVKIIIGEPARWLVGMV